MAIPREALERALAELNRHARPGQEARVVEHEPKRFRLSFFDLPLPEGQCLDQQFVEVQFLLHEREGVDTNLVGARYVEDEGRYVVDYELIEWD